MKTLKTIIFLFTVTLFSNYLSAQQTDRIYGKIMLSEQVPVKNAILRLVNTSYQAKTNNSGEYHFDNVEPGEYTLQIMLNDIELMRQTITVEKDEEEIAPIYISEKNNVIEGITIYGFSRNKFLDKDSTSVSKMPLKNLENPQAYTSINQQLMKEQLTYDVSEVLKNVPGMIKMQGSPGRGSGDGSFYYSLRGFPTKVSMVDGVPANTNGEIDPSDIERIEVIKGPSGTLYGGAVTSFGGLINVVTKKPKDYFGGEVSYLMGSYNLNRATVDVYGPVTDSRKTLFRLNAAYQYQNGFRDSEFRKSLFVAPTLSYEVNDRLKFDLGAQIYNYEGTNTPIIFLPRTRAYFAHNPDELGFDWKKSYSNNDITLKAPSINVKAEANYKISDRWNSQTLISRNFRKTEGLYQYQFIRGNTSDAMLERNLQWQNSEGSSTSIQQNFNGAFKLGKIKNKVLIGLDFLNQSLNNNHSPIVAYDNINGQTLQGYANISRDLVLQKIQTSTAPLVRNNTSSNLYGAYLSNVTYITDRLITLLSLRMDHYESKGQLNFNTNVRTGEFKQTAWSPKFGLVYQIIKDHLSAYGNYMNGFSYTAPVTQQLPEYSGDMKPQMANQWEFGVKGNLWRNKINFTVGYYDILVDNVQRGIGVIRDGKEYNITVQDGKQRSKGIEIETMMNPVQGLNIVAGYAYNDSKWEKADANVEGLRPESAGPANVFNSWISYILPIEGLKGLGLGFGVNRVGKQITGNKVITGQFIFPAYTLINASVSLEKERYRIGFKMNNLGNSQYFAGQGVVVAQMPRNFVAEVSLKF
ncbi:MULTISPECIES: TonB-dependent receptor [Chryseobacterium]|uniref:Iron complex outermembrane receptor protein n=1 Tax=Chryseobacterium camelliae TaxID=1265445 RepID=A0ABU0THX7_9FLAO|nr:MULTISPECIES: TonB-dependent receptor [Chryseobacterium]MDT3409473.1 iron complex outermembrane receptor protein [Pseudacidovorax intermedius]MDQ1096662.1 iron complex outermembrane receptor protein [Chryseobacterium camelliae]MDQ1100606.1 iron complex outermembrane receptor protein [Chryseobacterium sp. SORGH_AS_1048]MDR6087944.1 iron complex outermembrane receptor protein [Chryseobacterium sp. SORGH_AS_0909]MDR6132318.1 iron complex outermembrane receptor protein [Chryseobacterium sp. SOR